MAWNGTKPYAYLLASSHWDYRNIGSGNLVDGQLELEGLTALGGKESEAASAM